nr:M48 family metallopeptidase [Saccharopolyspora sp. HNM0983]
MHTAFFAVPIALVAGLLAIAVLTFRYDSFGGLKVLVAAAAVGAVFTIGLRAVLRPRVRTRGVPVPRAEQPQLSGLVEAIADSTGTPEPDEIRITSEPAVALREDTSLLGWRVRARYLEIGLPLLAALNLSELRAVLARELGSRAGCGRLAATALRIGDSVQRTASELTSGPTKFLFRGYEKTYARIAVQSDQQVHRSADAAAVRAAGRRAAVTSLRKAAAVEIGWADYAEHYLSMGKQVGHAPDVLLGFRSFMENPDRKPQLAERAKHSVDEGGSSGRRIEVIKRSSGPDKEVDDRPAFAVLRNPRKSVPALEDGLLVQSLGPHLPWPELARQAGAAHVAEQTARLAAAMVQSGLPVEPTIAGVLAAVHRGQGHDLVNPVLNPGLCPERVERAVVDTLTELLGCAVVDGLVCAQRAQHELDWAGPSTVRLTNNQPLDPDRLIRPAMQDPRLVPGLHRALVDLGVPLNHTRPPAAEPDPSAAGIVSPVLFAGANHHLIVTDRGLVLLPGATSSTKRLLSGTMARLRRAQEEQLRELADTPVGELRNRPGAQWVDSRDVADARLDQQSPDWTLALSLYLDEYAVSELDESAVRRDGEGMALLRLRGVPDALEHGDPYRGMGELMGARMDLNAEPAVPA